MTDQVVPISSIAVSVEEPFGAEAEVLKGNLVEGIWGKLFGTEGLIEDDKRIILLRKTGLGAALEARDKTNGSGPEAMIELRKGLQTEEMRIDETGVREIDALDALLQRNPNLDKAVGEALIQVIRVTMEGLGVPEEKIKEEIKHAETVAKYAEKANVKYDRVARLLALIHDGAKIVGNTVLLEAHAGTSAFFARHIMQALCEQLTEMGAQGLIKNKDGVCGPAKLATKVVTHEEGEFPVEEARRAKSDGIRGGMKTGVLFGNFYIYPETTDKVEITKDGVNDTGLREVLRWISSADKIVGSDIISSSIKYYTFYSHDKMFNHEDIDGLITDQLMSSFVYNLRNAPETKMKTDFLVSPELRRSVLFLMLLRGEIGKDLVYDLRDEWQSLTQGGDNGLLVAVDEFRDHHKWVRSKVHETDEDATWMKKYVIEATKPGEEAKILTDREVSIGLLRKVVEAAEKFDFSDKLELTMKVDEEIKTLFVKKYISEENQSVVKWSDEIFEDGFWDNSCVLLARINDSSAGVGSRGEYKRDW